MNATIWRENGGRSPISCRRQCLAHSFRAAKTTEVFIQKQDLIFNAEAA
jgi:hypothetical protein